MGQYDESKRQVIDASHKWLDQGLLMGTGGNVSVRAHGQRAMPITPSGFDYLETQPGHLCVLDWDLRPIEGDLKPSIEAGMHAATP